MNPLIGGFLRFWSRLTGQPMTYTRYRWRVQAVQQGEAELNFIANQLYIYPHFNLRIALQMLETKRLTPNFRYHSFRKAKANGGYRRIDAPNDALKAVQRQVLKLYLMRHPHPAAMAFQKKKSIADHVWLHAGAKRIITADIEDFFPNTKRQRIWRWWKQTLNSEQAAELATLLTTHRGSLPQGAPTSPALSNLVNLEMDKAIHSLVNNCGGVYSRYCDDMVFSWRGDARPTIQFQEKIEAILREYGYKLNLQKGWNVYQAKDEPEITGLILRKHGIVTLPDDVKAIIRDLERKEPHSPQLTGYRGFQKMVEERK